MTLFKQIMVAIITFGFIIFLVVGFINFNSLNNYIDDQLGANASHTATSLGLSIKPSIEAGDIPLIETMINSIFDSGYYQMIKLVDVDGNVLIENNQKLSLVGIPDWFANNIKFNPPVAKSEIMSGWSQFGTLYVQSSVGMAYYELYNSIKSIFIALFLIFIAMILFVYVGLKFIFRPLTRAQTQAEAILGNKFIIQDKIPFTTDLKHMVLAMNSMVEKVKNIFEKEAQTLNKYQELLYMDSITGLYNRRYFQTKFSEYLSSEEYSSGCIVLISCNNLINLKNNLGFEKLHGFLKEISQIFNKNSQDIDKTSFVCRISDNDFMVLFDGLSSNKILNFIDNSIKDVKSSMLCFGINDNIFGVNIAIVDYNPDNSLKQILTAADVTLAESKANGNFKYKIFENKKHTLVLGKEEYRSLIMNSMKYDMFKFASQNVLNLDGDLEHMELYLRLVDKNNKWQMASYFMPMVNELGLSALLDFYVIKKVENMISENIFNENAIAVNLGKEVISSDENFDKLTNLFKNIRLSSKTKIYIEIPNKNDISISSVLKLASILRKYRLGFGLDHFDINPISIEKLKDLNPDYVKIRSANIIDFFGDKEGEYTKKSLDTITSSKGIDIIAIGVENEEQKNKLIELGIKSMQGNYIDNTKNIG
ncbi:diguanylate cyclase/phosphodiesterase [Campylobacter pinnipediorum subsp. pinnipediorum]|uniref:bifunctional diguanylate cyclase/phosphodiesterase n=1 Tax=Campylobacter pinnipediorum TaxID=1965231 RepID=UPI000994EEF6|nr:LapD/MoxY N-terminal periplasmic domain-containing protein [Campylobacter pinnipediorum]AQW84964.1 diguanylate cyclase/phosphodiesterase [Campylobacter pinnipediorum subsp. pinnipediorum]